MTEWSKFCKETGNKHTLYEKYKACPDCGALNTLFSSPRETIEIPDDSPQPKKSLFSPKVGDTTTVRFQSYNQNPKAEIVRQASMQKARSINQSGGTKLTESLRTTVNLWLRTYKVVTQNNFTIEKQVDCSIIERTTVHLRDDRIESLNSFVRNTLLREVSRWKEMSKETNGSDDRLYLATEVHSKEGPIRLPRSADEIRTIKELLSKYFPLKTRTIHIVLEREDRDSYEEEDLLKNLPSIKKELSTEKKSSIKKEPTIKQEKKPTKQELHMKRPRSDSYEASKATRVRDHSSQNLSCTDLDLEGDLTDLDDIVSLIPLDDADKEDGNEGNERNETQSPMALRTRRQKKSKGKARA